MLFECGQSRSNPADFAGHGIVLFDGDCALCSRAISFIFLHDRRAYFRFASLQSAVGTRLLAEHGIPRDISTVVLIEGDVACVRSTAVLHISRHLSWPWKLFSVLLAVPRFLRDPVYRFIARRRYQWFGRRDHCPLPPPGLRERCLVAQNTGDGRPLGSL